MTAPTGEDQCGDRLLAALLNGMDAALCAFDADGVVTHWNREAERVLGWTAAEAVGRRGLSGWAVRPADAAETESRLLAAMHAPGRRVHDFALLTKDGGRVLVRTQSAAVPGPDGKPAGVYLAFGPADAQTDLERSLALSEALFDDAPWGVVLLDADLRPAVVNDHAARAFGQGRGALLGRPLGEVLTEGVREVEAALTHVLAQGAPPAPADLWVAVGSGADGAGERRRCWRSGFLRLASPLTEEPVPLGVAWLFQDVTGARTTEQEAAVTRFRAAQLHRASRAAAECEDPAEAAAVHLDFALAGFADHALLDRSAAGAVPDDDGKAPVRLVRVAATPYGTPGSGGPAAPSGLPVPYPPGHPAVRCAQRAGTVRVSAAAGHAEQWPAGAAHALCVPLRSRGRTLGVVTFLRGAARGPFGRHDVAHGEEVAGRVAAALDLAAAGGGG
ncbi:MULTISPECIES: PAS domain-containing protein [Streptomyces]|uniref:PAS domain-containing protein n=1 Tax=Streptomyces chilikensis TaxID=1194079 RepID=A0ABV3EMC7_9ACTN|nr:PAS domain-containing protein [Streptomyces sp. MJP52]MDH6226430.1 PAS domain S-box-containing protein [Streptomyces sp. MJP52]